MTPNNEEKKKALQHFNDENFEKEVLKSEIPVLVDFFAEWCGPCKIIAPIIEKLAEEFEGRVKIGKFDVDGSKKSQEMNIASIPTLVLFKNGQIVGQPMPGFKSEEVLRGMLEGVLK